MTRWIAAKKCGNGVIVSDESGQSVCFVWTDQPEGEANARLILQAPELLDMCEYLVALVSQANSGAFDNGVWDPTGTICEGEVIAAHIMEDARVLIAKAKGEL